MFMMQESTEEKGGVRQRKNVHKGRYLLIKQHILVHWFPKQMGHSSAGVHRAAVLIEVCAEDENITPSKTVARFLKPCLVCGRMLFYIFISLPHLSYL